MDSRLRGNGDVAKAGMTMLRYAIQTMALDSRFRGNEDVAEAGMTMPWTGGLSAVIPAKAGIHRPRSR
jgi:hypothetical protein